MFLYDDNSFSNGTYVIRDDAVLNVNTAFQYSGLEDLELDGAWGRIRSPSRARPSARPLRSPGTGSDQISVDSNAAAAGGIVDGVKSALIINGQGGTDNLTLEDQSDATGDRATIAGSTVGAAKGDTFSARPASWYISA